MEPNVNERAPKTESAKAEMAKTRGSFTPNVNQVFGAVFLVLIAIVAFAMLGPGRSDKASMAQSSSARSTQMPTLVSAHALASAQDVCGCYKSAFNLAAKGGEVQSTDYSAGFLQCRRSFGVEGSDAWTAGWQDQQNHKSYTASCRKYR